MTKKKNKNKNKNKALVYCERVVKGQEKAPKYVVKQCEIILPVLRGKDKKYIVDKKKLLKIEALLKILKMPKGLSIGEPIFDALAGFQWLLIVAALCVVHKKDPEKKAFHKHHS